MDIQLTTDRLILRVLTPEDAPRVARFYSHNLAFLEDKEPNVTASMTDVESQRRCLEREFDKMKSGDFFRYWYSLKDMPDVLIGTVCFQDIVTSAFHSCEIGYKQDIGCQGKGYATEAVVASIRELFKKTEMHRISAIVLTDNLPSIRLLDRIGFEYEGPQRSHVMIQGEWRDCLRYALIRS